MACTLQPFGVGPHGTGHNSVPQLHGRGIREEASMGNTQIVRSGSDAIPQARGYIPSSSASSRSVQQSTTGGKVHGHLGRQPGACIHVVLHSE